MAKLDLALVVRTVDQATRPLRRIQQTIRTVGRSTGLDRVGRQLHAVRRQMGRVGAGGWAVRSPDGARLSGCGWRGALLRPTICKHRRYRAKDGGSNRHQRRADAAPESCLRSGWGELSRSRSRRCFILPPGSARRPEERVKPPTYVRGYGHKHPKHGRFDQEFWHVLFNEVADAMHNNESPAQRAYAAQMLFGRAGRQMVKVLAQGSDEIGKQGAEMDDYRLITEAEARAAEEYVDQQLRLKQAISGVRNVTRRRADPGTNCIDKEDAGVDRREPPGDRRAVEDGDQRSGRDVLVDSRAHPRCGGDPPGLARMAQRERAPLRRD